MNLFLLLVELRRSHNRLNQQNWTMRQISMNLQALLAVKHKLDLWELLRLFQNIPNWLTEMQLVKCKLIIFAGWLNHQIYMAWTSIMCIAESCEFD